MAITINDLSLRGKKVLIRLWHRCRISILRTPLVPYSVIRGGDTVAVLTRAGLAKNFAHASTGGGATLVFWADGELPGFEALQET